MRVVHESHPNAQEAITDYKVLGSSVLGEFNQDLRSPFCEKSLTRSYTCGICLILIILRSHVNEKLIILTLQAVHGWSFVP